ncbi:hypothetical protein [Natrinema salinisoli]|uniref:hypothetical protein n=1 Tax=Natrinema salinisoli TaxID=2878535 RepID=UPI001CEFC6F3|nr:hypothetical protein [Natrinema salinisoli]
MPKVCEIRIGSRRIAAISMMVLVAVVLLFSFTDAGMYVRFALNNPTGSLSIAETTGNETDVDLVLHREDAEFLSRSSAPSIGFNFFAHEKLYCLELRDNEIVDVRWADQINYSDYDEVSGTCRQELPESLRTEMGIAHTHPRYSDELSETDREVSPPFTVTCLIFDEVTEIRGKVHGMRCWSVPEEEGGAEQELEELELAIVDGE